MVNAANFGDKLFDMEKDPKQTTVLEDNAIEAYMANLLQKAMKENDCRWSNSNVSVFLAQR